MPTTTGTSPVGESQKGAKEYDKVRQPPHDFGGILTLFSLAIFLLIVLCRLLLLIARLWQLGNGNFESLTPALIAVLTAFLTLVAIWQIPYEDVFSKNNRELKSAISNDSTPFSNRFGRTVIAGFGGLFVSEIAKLSPNSTAGTSDRTTYVVWFVFSFFALLTTLNLSRAYIETLRAFAILGSRAKKSTTLLVTFGDTFISLIQGRNQTRTAIVEQRIIDAQKQLIETVNVVRLGLEAEIKRILDETPSGSTPPPNQSTDVRVNVSLLSDSEAELYYIARNENSSRKSFNPKTVAWVSAITGEVRWVPNSYRSEQARIVLLDRDDSQLIPLAFRGYLCLNENKEELTLEHAFADRRQDYRAFIMFPFPAKSRGLPQDAKKGAIHISFGTEQSLTKIWSVIETPQGLTDDKIRDIYANDEELLTSRCQYDSLKTRLRVSIDVLGSLLAGFNESVFESWAPREH